MTSVFLIDTDILIELSKKVKKTVDWFDKAFEARFSWAVCSVNVAEFYSGVAPKDRKDWDDYFESIDCWTITKSISRQAGIWRYDFARKGTSLHTADSLIAATALAHNATLITNNIKDYPMSEIKLLSVIP